jgi:hypothetical protein
VEKKVWKKTATSSDPIEASGTGISVSSGKRVNVSYSIQGTYRKQAYSTAIKQDPVTKSWAWKGYVDFDVGCHSMFSTRSFATATEAEEQMRQAAHQCIDNRLG